MKGNREVVEDGELKDGKQRNKGGPEKKSLCITYAIGRGYIVYGVTCTGDGEH